MTVTFERGTAYRLNLEQLREVPFRLELLGSPEVRQLRGRELVEHARAERLVFNDGLMTNVSFEGQPAFLMGDETAAAAGLLTSLFTVDPDCRLWPIQSSTEVRDVVLAGNATFFYLGHRTGWLDEPGVSFHRYDFLVLAYVGSEHKLTQSLLRVRWTRILGDDVQQYFRRWDADDPDPTPDRAFIILQHRLLYDRDSTGQRIELQRALQYAEQTHALPDEFYRAAPSADAILLASMLRSASNERDLGSARTAAPVQVRAKLEDHPAQGHALSALQRDVRQLQLLTLAMIGVLAFFLLRTC